MHWVFNCVVCTWTSLFGSFARVLCDVLVVVLFVKLQLIGVVDVRCFLICFLSWRSLLEFFCDFGVIFGSKLHVELNSNKAWILDLWKKIWTKEGLYFYHKVHPPFFFFSLFIFASSFFLFFCCISNGGNNNTSCHHWLGSFPNNIVMWGGFSSLILTSFPSLAPFVVVVNGQRQGALPRPCFCHCGCLWIGTNCNKRTKRRKEEKNKKNKWRESKWEHEVLPHDHH